MTSSTAPTAGDPVAAARALFESMLYEDGLVGAVEGTFGPVARSGPHAAAEPQTHDPVVLLMGAIQVLTADLIDRMQRTEPFALSEQERWLVPGDLAPVPVPEEQSPAARGEVEVETDAAWRAADRAAERQAQFELTAVLAHAAMNQAAAVRAHATARLARFDRVPDSAPFSAQRCLAGEQPRPFDVVEHQPGHRAEFAGDLLGPALRLGPTAANSLVDDSVWLTTRVPGVLAAVGRGEVNIETAAAIAREVQEARPETCELVEEAVLRRRVHQRQRMQAQRSTRTLVGQHESEAARRSAKRTKAQQTGVWLDSHTTPGLSAFSAVMPTGKAVALMDAVDQRAHQAQQAARTGTGSAAATGERGAAAQVGPSEGGGRSTEVARSAMLLGEHRAEALYDLAMSHVDLAAHLELIVPQPPPEPPEPPEPAGPSGPPSSPEPAEPPSSGDPDEPSGPPLSTEPAEPSGPPLSTEPSGPPLSPEPAEPTQQRVPVQGIAGPPGTSNPAGSRTPVTPEEVRQLLADVPVLLHERAGPVPTADVVELLTGRAARTTAEWVQLPIDRAHDVVSEPHAPHAAKQPGPGQETEAGYRPGARMRRRVIRRDQRCRFPGVRPPREIHRPRPRRPVAARPHRRPQPAVPVPAPPPGQARGRLAGHHVRRGAVHLDQPDGSGLRHRSRPVRGAARPGAPSSPPWPAGGAHLRPGGSELRWSSGQACRLTDGRSTSIRVVDMPGSAGPRSPHERRLHWVVKLVTVVLTVLLLWLPLNGDDFTASPRSAASTENDTGEPGGSFRVTCASLVAVDPRIEDREKQGFWVVEPEGIRLTEIGRSAAASECADRRSRTLVWMVLLAVPVAALWSTWVADARVGRRRDPDSPVW